MRLRGKGPEQSKNKYSNVKQNIFQLNRQVTQMSNEIKKKKTFVQAKKK